MKLKLSFLCLALGLFAFACDDDDDDTPVNDGGVAGSGGSAGASGGSGSAGSEGSDLINPKIQGACEWLVLEGGTNDIEMEFDAQNASQDRIDKAVTLCVKELNGLPFCQDQLIDLAYCESEIDPDARYDVYPCEEQAAAKGECIHALSDADKQTLDDYTASYYKQYKPL